MARTVTAEKYVQLSGHTGAVYAIAPTEEPGQVFTAGSDGIIARWDIRSGTSLGALARMPGPVFSLCFQKDTSQLWVGRDDGGLHVIDVLNRQERKLFKNHEKGLFSIVPLGDVMYTSGGDGTVAVMDIRSLSTLQVTKVSEQKVRGLYADAATQRIFTASAEGWVREFSADLKTLHRQWHAHDEAANAIARLPDGKLITGGRDARLKTWNLTDLAEPEQNIAAHNYAVYRIRVLPEQGIFITASRDKTVKIWDLKTYTVLSRISRVNAGGHRNSVNDFVFFPDTGELVSVSDDGTIMGWMVIFDF